MSSRRIFLSLVLILSACKGTPPSPAAAPAPTPASAKPQAELPPLVFGLAMTLGVEETEKARSVLSDYFGKALHRSIEVRLFTNDELTDALADGKVDVAYIPPLAYVRAHKRSPVIPLRRAIHEGAPSYVSVLFVKKDSSIKTFADLAHKKVAWVQDGSASGNFIPRAMLRQRQIDPDKYFSSQEFLQDHGRVCEAVESGRADVGASFADVQANGLKPPDNQLQVDGCRAALGNQKIGELRVIYSSEPMPNDVVAVRSGTDPALLTLLSSMIDGMAKQPAAVAVLRDGFHADGFVKATESDFAALQSMVDSYSDATAQAR